ncbi:uncharacterized protein [Nicotiana tomentosiformis]|uniref:uncharacterized protein n=1 Tax=Nicotiana tomentosiformis TaxID=4098 RepID=UPI00388CDC46
MEEKKFLKKNRKLRASPHSMKLAGKLVKYNPSFIRNDDDDFEDLLEFGCDLGHATPQSVEGMQNTPIEGMQSTPIDRKTRSHSEIPSDRVTRLQTDQRVVVEKGTSSKRKIKMVGKDVVKDKGKGSKRKAKMDGHDVPSKKRKVHVDQNCSSSSDLKLWDYYVPLGDHYSTRISVHTNYSIVKYLKDTLDDQRIEMFRRTEVVSPKDDELWIKVNSTKLRFRLAEFCIITGLKCNGDPNKDYESVKLSRLMEFFLFSITNDDLIIKNDFLLVEFGDFETFPWGKVVFNATLELMKDKVRSRREIYRYGGLPLAFKYWFYECCPYTHKNLAYQIEYLVPRILNWTVKKKVTFKRLRKEFFLLSQEQLVFGNIAPTNVEQTRLELYDFIPVYEDQNAEVNPRDDVDPQTSNLSSSENELKLLRSEINTVNDKVSSLEQLMITSFEKVFKALGERDASKGNRKEDDHHDSHGHYDTGDIHKDYFGDKEVVENNFGSEEVMKRNIGSEKVVKKNVDTEVSLEQTVVVMEGVVKDSIEAGKSSEGVGDDKTLIEDAEPKIIAITQKFCDKLLVEDFVQVVGKNSCEEVGEDNGWTSDAETQITAITQNQNLSIFHGLKAQISKNKEDRIVVVDHDAPEMIPRERKSAGVMKSPFMNKFDSGGTIQVAQDKPTKSKKPILTNKSIFTIKYHFQGNVDNPVDFRILCKWNTFINRGLRTNAPDNVYTEIENKLNKIFEFGVDDIGEKNGSSHLHIPAYPCHIDVIFYYLRKKEKYGVDVPVRFTTTDYWFNCLISNLYKKFLEKKRDMNLITETDPIVEYILGYFLRYNVPWCTIDEVLFPINLSDKWYWILARLSFKDLRIYIYDSMSGARQNSAVRRSIEPYSVLLPYFLHRIGFLDTKENPMGIPTIDPFEIHVIDGLPTQDNTDCGVYVAVFAEYIIQGSNIPEAIDIDGIRNRYGILLWDYGVKKQRAHALSDAESTGRLKDLAKKDNKKKGKSHSVVDDKDLKDNKKKVKSHFVVDDKALKDNKKKGKTRAIGDDETLKDIKKKGKLKGKKK